MTTSTFDDGAMHIEYDDDEGKDEAVVISINDKAKIAGYSIDTLRELVRFLQYVIDQNDGEDVE